MRSTAVKVGDDVVLQSVMGEDDDWLGIGGVEILGVSMRDDARPLTIKLDTPNGYAYHAFKLRGVEVLPDGAARIALSAVGKHMGRGEYLDDYGQATVWLEPFAEHVEDELALELRPVSLTLGDRSWSGFSYRFFFKSAARQIHRVLTLATWEIGGRITGNTVLHQGQCNMPVYHGDTETLFSTACLRTLDQHGKPQGNSFQLGPRAGLLQGFDFQFSSAGALLQHWPLLDSVSSLLESPKGEDVLHVIDELHFDLTCEATTLEKHVLFTKRAVAAHEGRDLWWEARRHVYESIQKRFGVKETIVVPEVSFLYGTAIDSSDHTHGETGAVKKGSNGTGRLRMNVCGELVDHAEVPYAIAERLLPTLAAQGVKRLFADAFSESDVTVLGMRRKLDAGVHSDLHCASVCATHRFLPSEFWGGIKAWRHMADKAHALGMEIGTWFAQHFSPRAPIYQEHPDYRMIDVCGFPAGGGYGFQTLVVADWNSGIRQWAFDDLRRWHDEGGLDYLFIDSYSNMGMIQLNHAEKFRSNYAAFSRLLGDLQKIGIRSLSFESVSALGAARFGVADLGGEWMEQNKAVAGQNDFGWWVGEEDMLFNVWQDVRARQRGEGELERIQFKAMASRGYVNFSSSYKVDHKLPGWWIRLNTIYNQALPFMIDARRRLLPDGTGIRWESAKGTLYWTFAEAELERKHDKVLVFEGRNEERIDTTRLPAWGVYLAT